MSSDERRKHPRKESDAPLILLQPSPASGSEGAQLRDISLGGLAFESAARLERGSRFEFALHVPTRGWVDGTGTIRWIRRGAEGWLCGASITVERQDQKRLLRKWLEPSSIGVLRYFFPEAGGGSGPDDVN